MDRVSSVKSAAARRVSVLKDGIKTKTGFSRSPEPSLLESLRTQRQNAFEQGEKDIVKELDEQIQAILCPPEIGKTYRIRLCSNHFRSSAGSYLDAHRSLPQDKCSSEATFLNSHADSSGNETDILKREALSGQWRLESISDDGFPTSVQRRTNRFRLKLQTGHHGCPRGLYLCAVPAERLVSFTAGAAHKPETPQSLRRNAHSTWCFVQPLWCVESSLPASIATLRRESDGNLHRRRGSPAVVYSIWTLERCGGDGTPVDRGDDSDGLWRLRLVTEDEDDDDDKQDHASSDLSYPRAQVGQGEGGAAADDDDDTAKGERRSEDPHHHPPPPRRARSSSSLSRRAKADAARAKVVKEILSSSSFRGGKSSPSRLVEGDGTFAFKKTRHYLEVHRSRPSDARNAHSTYVNLHSTAGDGVVEEATAGQFSFELVYDAKAEAEERLKQQERRARADAQRLRLAQQEREEEEDRRQALLQVAKVDDRSAPAQPRPASRQQGRESGVEGLRDKVRREVVDAAPVVVEKVTALGAFLSSQTSKLGEKLGETIASYRDEGSGPCDSEAQGVGAPSDAPSRLVATAADRRSASGMAPSPSQLQRNWRDEDDEDA